MTDLQAAVRQLAAAAPRYRTFTRYYAGDHDLAFATEKWQNAFGRLFTKLADNLCPAVVDAVADRLELTGFGVEAGPDDLAAAAWDLWQANRMDVRAGRVHQEALRCGDAYVLVWPGGDGRPRFWPQRAEQVTVRYDEEDPGTLLWAAKTWVTAEKRTRLNLYYPDRIEKWIAGRNDLTTLAVSSASFAPYEAPGEPWPLPNPWDAVPLFPFANNAGEGEPGRSELHDAKPIQDALNKTLADMLAAMEFVALPQRWATGLEVEFDEATGKPKVPFTPGVERIWAVASEEVRFGEFAAANLAQFLQVAGDFRLEIARVTNTPPHFVALITDPPSGEALKTLEARFVKKVRDRQATFGNAWEDALSLALRMAGLGEGRLRSEWKDPAPKGEKEQAETVLLKQQAGISRRQALAELGYADQDIEKMLGEREAESAQLGERMLAAFDRGQ